jgi:hypothetical protein
MSSDNNPGSCCNVTLFRFRHEMEPEFRSITVFIQKTQYYSEGCFLKVCISSDILVISDRPSTWIHAVIEGDTFTGEKYFEVITARC